MPRFSCPKCKTTLETPAEQAGKIITCPKCQAQMKVPSSVPQPQPAKPALLPVPAHTEQEWYYAKSGQKVGPVTEAKLKRLAQTGQLTRNDMVWKAGMSEWIRAERIRGLFSSTPSAAPAHDPIAPQQKASSPVVDWQQPSSPAAIPQHQASQASGFAPTVAKPGILNLLKSLTATILEKILERAKKKDEDEAKTSAEANTHQKVAAWVFGSLFFLVLTWALLFAPSEMPAFKQRLLAIFSSLLAGLFTFFLSGQINLEFGFLKMLIGELGVKATGGVAVFALVLIWWLSPLAPVGVEAATHVMFDPGMGEVRVAGAASSVSTIRYSFDGKKWEKPEKETRRSTEVLKGVEVALVTGKVNRELFLENRNAGQIYVKYLDQNGKESKVYTLAFKPDEAMRFVLNNEKAEKEAHAAITQANEKKEEAMRIKNGVDELTRKIRDEYNSRGGPQHLRRKKNPFHTDAVYDSKTGYLELVYKFQSSDELKDFELSGAVPTLSKGVLKLDNKTNLLHVAKFTSLRMSGQLLFSDLVGKHFKTTANIWVGGTEKELYVLNENADKRQQYAAIPFSRTPDLTGFEFMIKEHEIYTRIGSKHFRLYGKTPSVGQVMLLGGTGGNSYANLRLSGRVDSEWAKSFIGE